MAVKKTKKKVSTLVEPMHGGQNSESPAVAYSRCLHRHLQSMSIVRQLALSSEQTQSAVSAAAVGLCQ